MSATHTEQQTPPVPKTAVQEQPVQFGPDRNLVGVLARSRASSPASTRPAVLFLNAGVIHRIGPHRLHVNLARDFAARGVTSLRIDLSGIGDSRPVPGSLSFRQSSVADAKTAMDWLRAETGLSQFVLFGLCSGADNAIATALADERVVGLVLLDPPAYVTPQARMRKVAARVQNVGWGTAVANWGAGLVRRTLNGSRSEIAGGREVPPIPEYRQQLTALVERNVSILAVFSGSLRERYNHPEQLFELFPELRGRVDLAYFPTANHMFTEFEAQAALMATVTPWVEGRL
jgi:pimeloyl-ACP methyl ester carboxylesterase